LLTDHPTAALRAESLLAASGALRFLLRVANCCTGAQEWRWRNQNRLVNTQSGRCLDVIGGNGANGVRLQIWDCNGGTAQAWYLP